MSYLMHRISRLTRDSFWRLFWVDAINEGTLEVSFSDIIDEEAAKRDGVLKSASAVVQWLLRINKNWLLILDNADGEPNEIARYLPLRNRDSVIITSRNLNMQ
jgi:hypothetical protein